MDGAAIAITEGVLVKLTPDEIKGVIAHEFGYLYNSDFKISLRVSAMVMGSYFVLIIYLKLLQVSSFRRRDEKSGSSLALIVMVLLGAGLLIYFAGSILKAMVSLNIIMDVVLCEPSTRNPLSSTKS